MIEAALKSGTIVVPPELVAPQQRYEQAVVAAVEDLIAEHRRAPQASRNMRRERGGTVH